MLNLILHNYFFDQVIGGYLSWFYVLVQQEKLVQEAIARSMPQPTLTNPLYPAIPMPIYGATAMAPIMHVPPPVTHHTGTVKEQSPSDISSQSSYVQELQSKCSMFHMDSEYSLFTILYITCIIQMPRL